MTFQKLKYEEKCGFSVIITVSYGRGQKLTPQIWAKLRGFRKKVNWYVLIKSKRVELMFSRWNDCFLDRSLKCKFAVFSVFAACLKIDWNLISTLKKKIARRSGYLARARPALVMRGASGPCPQKLLIILPRARAFHPSWIEPQSVTKPCFWLRDDQFLLNILVTTRFLK